jgi:uncharacterized membrane protein required for colicin V production
MNITWLGAAAAVFLAAACIQGYRRGFIKEVVSVFLMLFSFTLVWMINPYVNSFLKENTPIYGVVQESCQNLVETKLQEGTAVDAQAQSSLLEELSLPTILKDNLAANNTIDTYKYLAVSSFTGYVSSYLATTVVNGISFALSYLLATVLIRTVTYALNLLARLPLIKGINRIAGIFVGAVKGTLILWVALLILTLFCSTELGGTFMELVEKDTILSFLYEKNIFVQIYMNIFYGQSL